MSEEQGSSIEGSFLDPEGRSLEDFERALVSSVRLFRFWWKGVETISSPLPSNIEIKKLVSTSEQMFASSSLTRPYSILEPCIKALLRNTRFNKNNMMNVHPAPLLPSVVASLFAMLQNPNNLSPVTSPATTIMEEECISQLAELVGFHHKDRSAEYGGNLVSCGSLSNLTALMVAREKAYTKSSSTKLEPLRETGLFGVTRGVILISNSAHYSIQKAVRILGLGDRSLVRVPAANSDEIAEFEKSGTPLKLKPSKEDYVKAIETIQKGRKRVDSKSQLIISVVPTLGTINTGTIEPIQPLVELKDEFGFHLHVDAAIGGLALGLSEVRTKASGVEYADSITVDPHKLGYLPYPCSAIIFRRKSDLDAIAIEAPYIGPCANTIEGSRPGTGAAGLWVAQQTLGVSGYNRIISNCIELTKGLADRLREEGFQILHEIDLNTVCFSIFGDGIPRKKLNKSTNMLHTRVVSDGRFLLGKVEDISGVMVKDKPWQPDSERVGLTAIKAWIMDPNTRDSDIESLVDELLRRKREIS